VKEKILLFDIKLKRNDERKITTYYSLQSMSKVALRGLYTKGASRSSADCSRVLGLSNK
jgi:hypothetical protein